MKKNQLLILESSLRLRFLFLISVCFLFGKAYSQQLDNLNLKQKIKTKPKFTAGLTANQSYYVSDGPKRYNPYNFSVAGNANITYMGFALPATFAFTNQQFTYTYKTQQPFNIVGLSPSYKNLTLHGGYRNLTYSSYTLAGHAFLGGGAEYKKDKFVIAGMYGRFLKAIEYDSSNIYAQPSYERWGTALKAGFSHKGNELILSTFYAKDQINSLQNHVPNVDLKPQENQVYSLSVKKNLQKNVTLQTEGAFSGWTRDLTAPLVADNKPLTQAPFWMNNYQSTHFYKALKTNFNVNMKTFDWGLAFDYVEPEFKTLGAYFFNNDYQNVTLNAGTKIFKDKIQLKGSIGKQRDDLNNTKASKMKRTVGNISLNFKPGKKLNATFNYSNFNGFTNIKPIDRSLLTNTQFQRVDTLNFVQTNQALTSGINYILLSNDNVNHQLMLGSSLQYASNKQGSKASITSIQSANLGFNSSLKKSGVNFGVSLNANQNNYLAGKSLFAGLGMNSSVPLFKKKLSCNLNGNISKNYENQSLKAFLYVLNNSYSLKFLKKHQLTCSIRYSGRSKKAESNLSTYNTAFNEMFFNMGYSVEF